MYVKLFRKTCNDFSTIVVPPSTPQILVQKRVNSYQISLRGPPGVDTFGAPRLGDHYSNQPIVTKKDINDNGWTGSREKIKSSKFFHFISFRTEHIEIVVLQLFLLLD